MDLCEPSERLLDHYKKKAVEWKEKFVELMSQVEDCKIVCSQYADAEVELLKRETETSRLKSELIDVKQRLFDEKKHVMKLVADKDRLRLQLLDSKRTFKTFLDVLGLKECEISDYLQHPKNNSVKDDLKSLRIKKGVKKILELGLDPDLKINKLNEDLSAARLNVKLLESQLEEQHCLFKEEIDELLKDRRETAEQHQEVRKRLKHRISCLNCRLETTRKKICDKLFDKIDKQVKDAVNETKLMIENEKLMKCLIICKEMLGDEFPADLDEARPKRLRDEITRLQGELSEKLMAISTMQTQAGLLRSRINKMQMESDENAEKYQRENEKWQSKCQSLNRRFEKEHKRRVNEAVGFRNDIKLLRTSLQSLERQIRIKEIRAKHESNLEQDDQQNIKSKRST